MIIPAAVFFADAFVFLTLQGLFNCVMYMYPKVMKAKRSKKKNLSWFQAFAKALMSKGEKGGSSL